MGSVELGRWKPLSIREAADLLVRLDAPWWIAGGWAIDLFVGRQTRPHEDLDVGMLRRDQFALQRYLRGWDLYAAGGGMLRSWVQGELVEIAINNIWARPAPGAPWSLQFMLNEAQGDEWVFRRNPAVSRPLEEVILHDASRVPYLAPEVQLLFKAKTPRARDQADFEAVLPLLSLASRRWLAGALTQTHPGHAWLDRL